MSFWQKHASIPKAIPLEVWIVFTIEELALQNYDSLAHRNEL